MRPIHLCFAPARYNDLLLSWPRSMVFLVSDVVWTFGNCQTRVIGNLASSLTCVIIVCGNIFYVFGIIYG